MTIAPPEGIVTFVFTDIEGSTTLLKTLGDAYADVTATHRAIIRETFTQRGGVEIDTQGDAFFFAFATAADAVGATVAAQLRLDGTTWPHGTRVRVRMSVHTGEPVLGEEGYVGIDVVRAARICAAGHGGQVLLSAVTVALLTSMPEGVQRRDLGEFRLKDLDEPERLYQLDIDGLPSRFPPLRTHGEEPLDLGAKIERRVNALVEQSILEALDSPDRVRDELPRSVTKLAAGGMAIAALAILFTVLVIAAIIGVIALLLKLIF